jgi:fengycin family lipopeptide synthetase D
MVDLHHIISDGFSNQILIKEFLLFYEGITLPQLRIQYKEVAHWQNMKSTESGLKKQKDYWETELRGEIPLLKLPCDFPRTDSENPIGDQVVFELYGVTLKELKNLALREEVTMFTLLFAIYCVLLFKITGQTDIVVGTVIAGRTHPDMETIIGMFVNTLAIRSKPKGTHDFKMFIKAMRKNLLMAFDNQEYQFEELVNTLKPLRENFRNPIFDVVFNYTSWGESPKGLSGLQITPFQRETKQTKFDLILAAEETKESLVLGFIFNTGLFKKQTIRRFEGYFKEILNTLLKEPGLLLEEIRISHDLNRVTSDEYTEEPGGFDFN